jgi:hypothetical protein
MEHAIRKYLLRPHQLVASGRSLVRRASPYDRGEDTHFAQICKHVHEIKKINFENSNVTCCSFVSFLTEHETAPQCHISVSKK